MIFSRFGIYILSIEDIENADFASISSIIPPHLPIKTLRYLKVIC